MIAGKDAVRDGEAKNSWLTGKAAWNFVAISLGTSRNQSLRYLRAEQRQLNRL
jgi:hypothetical protein